MEDFASPAYHRLARGYRSLEVSLAQDFVEQGGVVHLETRATSLSRAASAIRVSAVGPDHRRETTFIARHVVLALPRRSLELLDPDSFIFTDQFRADLTTVTPE